MASTYTLIASNVLSSSAASVTFSSIPSTYTDLVLRGSARFDTSGSSVTTLRVRFNGDTAFNYSYTRIIGSGNAGASSSRGTGTSSYQPGVANAALSTSNTFTSIEQYIPNYLSTSSRAFSASTYQEDNTAEAYIYSTAALYRGTSAISSMVLDTAGGNNFVSGTTFYLYGIKNS